jgi:HD-like signal output (HDOD) protein
LKYKAEKVFRQRTAFLEQINIMSASDTSTNLDQLFAAIDNNEIPLPAMPDLAIKIQKMLSDVNSSTQKIAALVSTDPVLASQVIKTANSALYIGKTKVETVPAAVSRIGFQMLRNIIMTFTMNKLSTTTHPIVKKLIDEFWAHSRDVAAISYVLAKNHRNLNQDEAMMAGLIHDIGTLPLCLYAEKMVQNLDESSLRTLLEKYRAIIGNKLLTDWKFPSEITEVMLGHEDLQREADDSIASYVDIVTVANILNPTTTKTFNWESVRAVKSLNFTQETCQSFFEIFENQLRAAKEMFNKG